ncbi:CRISPR-associated endonuclease Cas9 [mine drainage metagenome]|uniref:CRISPR-associated endonuclease Cas9 n=1 Tax=mine drainage metagenome TaxID=410659 RepID=A0A1J5PDH9_9ZZZZ
MPWGNYREHVRRAIDAIWVSHKPDHSHEGAMHNDTAYGLRGDGKVSYHKIVDGQRIHIETNIKVIEITNAKATDRHGSLPNGEPKPYKGYKGNSNYCIEIICDEKNKWEGEVISTFDAYQVVRKYGVARVRHPTLSISGKPLVMRLMKDDAIRMVINEKLITARVCWVRSDSRIAFAGVTEANVDVRDRDKKDSFSYITKTASILQKLQARHIGISPVGELHDPGFKE